MSRCNRCYEEGGDTTGHVCADLRPGWDGRHTVMKPEWDGLCTHGLHWMARCQNCESKATLDTVTQSCSTAGMDIKLRDLIRVVNAAAQVEEMNFRLHVDVTRPGFGESFRDWIASASTEDLTILALSLQKLLDAAHSLVQADVRLSASECIEAKEE